MLSGKHGLKKLVKKSPLEIMVQVKDSLSETQNLIQTINKEHNV